MFSLDFCYFGGTAAIVKDSAGKGVIVALQHVG